MALLKPPDHRAGRASSLHLVCRSLVSRAELLQDLRQAQVSGAAPSHWELSSELLGRRPLHAVPLEQVKLSTKEKKIIFYFIIRFYFPGPVNEF